MNPALVLVVIEGFGIGGEGQGNPIFSAEPKNLLSLIERYPSASLHASGIPVGLNWGEAANGEFGNVLLGSGRVIPKKSIEEKGVVAGTLGEAISNAGKNQLRIAETRTYPWATTYFNGFNEEAFSGEFRVQIPSETYARPAEHPELMARAITDRVVMSLRDSAFDFILVNYANLDAMANTGNYEATVRSVNIIDREVGRLIEATNKERHTIIITSSHGNAESLMNERTGLPETTNNANPVPFIVVNPELKKNTSPFGMKGAPSGIIADVAPTILEIMGIPKPKEMTGESLIGLITR